MLGYLDGARRSRAKTTTGRRRMYVSPMWSFAFSRLGTDP
jgi:hypothetical protein